MRLSSVLEAALVFALTPVALAQTTWYVDGGGVPPGAGTSGDPYTSIQYGLEHPNTGAGDTFLVAPGEYIENLVVPASFVTLRSTDGPQSTIVRATNGAPVFTTELEATIEGFTFGGAAGEPVSSAGVRVDVGGNLTITRCVIRGCDVGLWNEYDAWVRHSTLSSNGTGINLTAFGGLSMENTIVWGNAVDMTCSGFIFSVVSYCAGFNTGICGQTGGMHNIIGDPLMWNWEDGEFFLKPGSPCIGAGTPAGADIGAFDYDPDYAPQPQTYCTGKLNSLGCVPAIGWSGKASATDPDPFEIRAEDVVPGKLGFVLYSGQRWAIPFQGGFHCVRPPTKRTTPVISGNAGMPPCPGTFEIDFNARIQGGSDPALLPGVYVYAQYWHRDLQEPAGFGSGLSDALCFAIAP